MRDGLFLELPGRRGAPVHGRALLVAALLLALLGLITTAPDVRADEVAVVATDALNLRSGPGTSADILAVMVQGEAVAVLDGPRGGGWYRVAYDDLVGWAYGRYLAFDGPANPGPERWIDVNRTTRTVSLMVGDEAIAAFSASLGWDQSDDGFYATAVGTYSVYGKNADLTYTPWANAYIVDWVAFDPNRQNGFHAWTMDASGNVLPNGAGPTGGCVALAPWAADELYAFAVIGMRVEVHW